MAVDEKIQRVGVKAGIEVKKTDSDLFLIIIEGQGKRKIKKRRN